jgi:hypothetical protein
MAFFDTLTGPLKNLFSELPFSGGVASKSKTAHDVPKVGFMGSTSSPAHNVGSAPAHPQAAQGIQTALRPDFTPDTRETRTRHSDGP